MFSALNSELCACVLVFSGQITATDNTPHPCPLRRFRSDHNEDKTDVILAAWQQNASADYHSVHLQMTDVAGADRRRASESGPFDWPNDRHQAIIDLKQEALEYAKRNWADFVFVSSNRIVRTTKI